MDGICIFPFSQALTYLPYSWLSRHNGRTGRISGASTKQITPQRPHLVLITAISSASRTGDAVVYRISVSVSPESNEKSISGFRCSKPYARTARTPLLNPPRTPRTPSPAK